MILVPYTYGAATPSQIAAASLQYGGCRFAVNPDDSEAQRHAPLLRMLGDVVQAGSVDEMVKSCAAPPTAVVTFAEELVPVAARVAERFGLPGMNPETASALIDKAKQRTALNDAGVSKVATVRAARDQVPVNPPLPGVLKPLRGSGSASTVFVDDLAELEAAVADIAEGAEFVLEQRMYPAHQPLGPWLADYLSVESFVVDGEVTHLGMTGRLPQAKPARETAMIFPLTLPDRLRVEILELVEAAIAALDIDLGVLHTEVMLTDDGPQLIEVNGRLGGGLVELMTKVGRVDPSVLAMALFAGLELPELREPSGVAMHWYVHPPVEAVQLLSTPDPHRLLEMPGVFGLGPMTAVGTAVDWRVGMAHRVLDVCIEGESLEQVAERQRAVESYVFETLQWRFA